MFVLIEVMLDCRTCRCAVGPCCRLDVPGPRSGLSRRHPTRRRVSSRRAGLRAYGPRSSRFAGASEAVAVACVRRLSARPTAGFRSCSASTFVELRISNENGKTNRCVQAPRYAGGGAHGGAPRKTGGWLVHAG